MEKVRYMYIRNSIGIYVSILFDNTGDTDSEIYIYIYIVAIILVIEIAMEIFEIPSLLF